MRNPSVRTGIHSVAKACLWAITLISTAHGADTEFGVMWRPPDVADRREEILRELHDAGVHWFRTTGGSSVAGASNAMVWWPAATPVKAWFAPQLNQWRLDPNLWQVYWQCRLNPPRDTGTVAAFEIGNEPDIHFTADLPDLMAANLKAAWWGFKTADSNQTVLMPSLAARPGPYADALVANGIGNYTDGWNFHFYGWPQDFADSVAAHRRFLSRKNLPAIPLWLTEYGYAAFRAGSSSTYGIHLARQRAFFERMTMEGAASSLAKHWAFCLFPYVEGGLDMGMYGDGYEERPALPAYRAVVARLRQARPRYRIRHRSSGATVGLVFELEQDDSGRTWWTMLCSPNRRGDFHLPESRGLPPAPASSGFPMTIRFPRGFGEVTLGLDGEHGRFTGRELQFTSSAETNLHLLGPPRRFEVDGCRWDALEPRRPARARPKPSPVIATLRPVGGGISIDKAAVAYRYNREQPIEFELVFYNFSGTSRQGRWRLRLPRGWRRTDETVLNGNLPLAPLSDERIVARVIPPPQVSPARRDSLRLTWVDREARDVAQVTLARAGPASGNTRPLPDRWRADDSGLVIWTNESGPDQARYTLSSPAEDVTSSFVLPLSPRLRLDENDTLRLRMRLTGMQHIPRRRVELVTIDREVFRYGNDLLPETGWHTIECRVGDFTPAFWSRTGDGNPARARYIRVVFYGLRAGTTVELEPVVLVRPR